jgi:hypothetical protein
VAQRVKAVATAAGKIGVTVHTLLNPTNFPTPEDLTTQLRSHQQEQQRQRRQVEPTRSEALAGVRYAEVRDKDDVP